MSIHQKAFHQSIKRFGKRSVIAVGCRLSDITDLDFNNSPVLTRAHNANAFFLIKDNYKSIKEGNFIELNKFFIDIHKHLFFKPKCFIRYENNIFEKIRLELSTHIDSIFDVHKRLVSTDKNSTKILNQIYEPLRHIQKMGSGHRMSLDRSFDKAQVKRINLIIDPEKEINLEDSISDLNLLLNTFTRSIAGENTSSLSLICFSINWWSKSFNIPFFDHVWSKIKLVLLNALDEHPFIEKYKGQNLAGAPNIHEADILLMPTEQWFRNEYATINELSNEKTEILKKKMLRSKRYIEKTISKGVANFYFYDATRYLNPYRNIESIGPAQISSILNESPQLLHSLKALPMEERSIIAKNAWSMATEYIASMDNSDIEKYWKI